MASRNTFNTNISPLKPEDLKNNEIAISILMSQYGKMEKDLDNLKSENSNLNTKISNLNTDLAAMNVSKKHQLLIVALNILGSILVAIGVNLITSSDKTIPWLGWSLLLLGIIALSISNGWLSFYKNTITGDANG